MNYNLVIPQGTDWTHVVVVKDSNGNVVDLTGVSEARSKMKTSYFSSSPGTTIGASVYGGTTLGQIKLTIDNATTTALKPNIYVYDVELVWTDGATVSRILEGTVNLTPEVS